MNAEFNWWLLIVGLVLGAALTWLVMAESARRDADVDAEEQRGEAVWIASMLSREGPADGPNDERRVEEILRLHREYLGAPPPDEPEPPASAEWHRHAEIYDPAEVPDAVQVAEVAEVSDARPSGDAPPSTRPGTEAPKPPVASPQDER